jgi:hypothetical protein
MELKDILVTNQLLTRKSRPVDVFAERRALNTIARRMAYGHDAVLQELCESALTLCGADSSGISILQDADEGNFTLHAVAGGLAGLCGATTPRHHSPYGALVQRSCIHTPNVTSNGCSRSSLCRLSKAWLSLCSKGKGRDTARASFSAYDIGVVSFLCLR